jgi:hypothetical protein
MRFRDFEPNKSGNMARNATKLTEVLEDGDGFIAAIYIDTMIAPYSIYTVIPWLDTSKTIINAPRAPHLLGKSSFLWNDGDKPHGTPKKNPNEGWIDFAVKQLADIIREYVSVTTESVAEYSEGESTYEW